MQDNSAIEFDRECSQVLYRCNDIQVVLEYIDFWAEDNVSSLMLGFYVSGNPEILDLLYGYFHPQVYVDGICTERKMLCSSDDFFYDSDSKKCTFAVDIDFNKDEIGPIEPFAITIDITSDAEVLFYDAARSGYINEIADDVFDFEDKIEIDDRIRRVDSLTAAEYKIAYTLYTETLQLNLIGVLDLEQKQLKIQPFYSECKDYRGVNDYLESIYDTIDNLNSLPLGKAVKLLDLLELFDVVHSRGNDKLSNIQQVESIKSTIVQLFDISPLFAMDRWNVILPATNKMLMNHFPDKEMRNKITSGVLNELMLKKEFENEHAILFSTQYKHIVDLCVSNSDILTLSRWLNGEIKLGYLRNANLIWECYIKSLADDSCDNSQIENNMMKLLLRLLALLESRKFFCRSHVQKPLSPEALSTVLTWINSIADAMLRAELLVEYYKLT